MDLATIFNSRSCSVNLKARNKEGALEALAALASRSGKIGSVSEKAIAIALSDREAQGSTGFGDEIAFPHARITGLEGFIIFIAHAPKGVDFDSLDKKKVKLFFVIIGPENRPSEHVQILATLSRSLSGTTLKKELLAAESKDIIAELFLRHTHEGYAGNSEKKKMKLLVLILYMEEFIYHILEYFLEEGVEGATILDSSGMGQYISNIPLFATFIGFMNEQKNRSNIILATIPADREDEIIKGIEEITGDLDKKQGAMLMTLDIGVWKGTMKMM
ncbi:MAG: PTS sugar transporter subunit IIA [Spirochaetaceae bacterium]|nr:PTS sugar transporter subunit IIA [Spirochaetaceae bacterium]